MHRPPEPEKRRRADVAAGTLVGVFGLRGELKLDASRVGLDALRPGMSATVVLPDGTSRAVELATVRMHQGRPLVAFTDVGDATAAEAFVRGELRIARNDAPLAEGEYFDDDLIGCRLVDEHGVERGTVTAVLHYPAQDLLAVGPRRALVPLVRAFVAHVDVERREIRVTIPPGLLDDDAEEA